MTIDPRLHRIVAAQPYPLLFATISGAHLYGFPSPDSVLTYAASRDGGMLPLDAVVGIGWSCPDLAERGCLHPQSHWQLETADDGIRAPKFSNWDAAVTFSELPLSG